MSDIRIDIEVITAAAKNAVRGLNSEFKKTQDAIRNKEKSITQLNSRLKLFAGAAAGIAFGTFIKGAVASASRLEDLSTRFNTLTQDAEKTKDLLAELAEFSTVTPFELNEISEAGAKLLSFGFSAGEVTKRLQEIGDVSAASGKDLNEVTLIFGQVAAAGKLTGERFLQLTERAIPIGPAIAKTMGVAESAVQGLISSGQVTFEVFDKAFKSLSQDGGPAFEGMIKQSKTLSGLISTLKGNFDLFLGTIGQKLLPTMKAAVLTITNLIKVIQDNSDLIIGGLTAMGVAIIAVSAKFIALKLAAAAAWIAAAAPVALVVGAITAVGVAIALVIRKWDTIKIKAQEFFKTAIDGAITAANALGLPTEALERARNSLQRNIDATKEKIRIEAELAEIEKQQAAERKRIAQEEAERNRQRKAEEEADFAAKQARDQKALAEQKRLAAEKLKAETELKNKIKQLNFELAVSDEQDRLVAQEATVLFQEQRLTYLQDVFTREEQAALQARLNLTDNALEKESQILQIELDGQRKRRQQEQEFEKQRIEDKKKADQLAIRQRQQFFSAAASLQSSSNKTLFRIGQAGAIANATVNAGESISSSYKFGANIGGPALGAVFGGIAAAATAAQIAQIASAKAPAFQDGGIVPGNSFSGDNVAAQVNSGEVILNREQQAQTLFAIANGGGASGERITNVTVELDGEVVGRAVSRQVADGLELGEIA